MRVTLSLLLATVLAVPAVAQSESSKPTHQQEAKGEVEKAEVRAPVEERSEATKGTVTIAGARINYTATAGTLTIRDDGGKPTASLFYTAYTRDGAGNRPVTFLFNGGPGSATIWLHMGSIGPVRVVTDSPVHVAPHHYSLAPNPHSLLDRTDLVFIDMVGAGWSRPLGDKPGKDFWGVDQDADTFARAIMRWVAKHNRWSSPKVVLGESYGTLRAGALGAVLEQRGMSLDGIIFLSAIMNYGVRQPGYDQNSLVLLPTYAATAWHHNRIPNRPANLATFLAEVRAFVAGPYAAALAKGDAIGQDEGRAIARQMAAYTGLSEDFILRADLRVSLSHFRTELLRDQRVATGRLDTRYRLDVADANADSPEEDPASTAITGAYYASFQDYAVNRLGFRTDLTYRLSARDSGGFDWDWRHRPPGERGAHTSPNTGVDLAWTMRTNPALKVLFLNGYYDAATPFYSTEFDVAHMGLPAAQRRNVTLKYYEAGHMFYTDQASLAQLRADLVAWYDEATRR
jgi:carboxypeptidase C (cathepsin A)